MIFVIILDPPTRAENCYFITFIDNISRFCYSYLIKFKDEAHSKFMIFKAEAENQLGKTIKVLKTYRGGGYTLNAMPSFC